MQLAASRAELLGKRSRESETLLEDQANKAIKDQANQANQAIKGTSLDPLLRFAKNGMAGTAHMPDGMKHPEAGLTEEKSKFMINVKYTFPDPKYWTSDEKIIETNKQSGVPIFNQRGPYVSKDRKQPGDVYHALNGYSFIVRVNDTQEYAFLYSAWWDGLFMRREVTPDPTTLPTLPESVTRIDDAQLWLEDNKHLLTNNCGDAFASADENGFAKELLAMIEYVHVFSTEDGTAFAIMKTNPLLRDQTIGDTLYVELVCSSLRGGGTHIMQRNGVAEQTARFLKKKHILLSTLYTPKDFYTKMGFGLVSFDDLRKLSQDVVPSASPSV
jgi:hypothetical protein